MPIIALASTTWRAGTNSDGPRSGPRSQRQASKGRCMGIRRQLEEWVDISAYICAMACPPGYHHFLFPELGRQRAALDHEPRQRPTDRLWADRISHWSARNIGSVQNSTWYRQARRDHNCSLSTLTCNTGRQVRSTSRGPHATNVALHAYYEWSNNPTTRTAQETHAVDRRIFDSCVAIVARSLAIARSGRRLTIVNAVGPGGSRRCTRRGRVSAAHD